MSADTKLDQGMAVVDVPSSERKRAVIVGGGFAGLAAARALRHADAEVVLIDRRDHHIFQPLLYQVATERPPVAVNRLPVSVGVDQPVWFLLPAIGRE